MTSALYLGLRHPSAMVEPWSSLTTGVPAAMTESTAASSVATVLASLQGCQAGILAPSTLHLLWDLLGGMARRRQTILIDRGAYAVSHWAGDYARALGATVLVVPHYDAGAIDHALARMRRQAASPVIVVDGYCTGCGRPAPLLAMRQVAQQYGALIVCDDTQALGVLGDTPSAASPYGRGGGGSLRQLPDGVRSGMLLVTSMAKAFGVPVAGLSGDRDVVREFVERSKTRVHCSPPSAASILAARAALALNAAHGDALREQLAGNVVAFRQAMHASGVTLHTPGLFPVQSTPVLDAARAERVHARLAARGLNAVRQRSRCGDGVQLTFLVSAHHSRAALARGAREVGTAMRVSRSGRTPAGSDT